MNTPGPHQFSFPDDLDPTLEEARAALELLPRDEHWDQAAAAPDQVPDKATRDPVEVDGSVHMGRLLTLQAERHTGSAAEGTATVVLDASGHLVDLAFGEAAVRLGANGIAAAVRDAWDAAEARRVDAALAFAEESAALAPGLPAAQPHGDLMRVQQSIQGDLDARRHERFERTSDDGRFTAAVDLVGALVALDCRAYDVDGTDRDALARGLAAAIGAAQAEALAVVGAICDEHYRELE